MQTMRSCASPLLICFRSAIEILEAELRESSDNLNLSLVEEFVQLPIASAADVMTKQGIDVVSCLFYLICYRFCTGVLGLVYSNCFVLDGIL